MIPELEEKKVDYFKVEIPKKPVILIAGASGAGKSRIVKSILKNVRSTDFMISGTTRPMRPGEMNSVHYYFYLENIFQEKITAGEFFESEEVYKGCWYGTLKSEILRIMNEGNIPVGDLDVQGCKRFMDLHGPKNTCVIYIQHESMAILEQQLRLRGTDSETQIQTRLAKAGAELEFSIQNFEYSVVNRFGKFEETEKECIMHVNTLLEKINSMSLQ